MKQLKVGDVIYARQYGKMNEKYIIERVTQTQAISSSGTKFKIECTDRGLCAILPRVSWNTVSYFLETPETKEEYNRAVSIYKISKFDYSKLTTDQLNQIVTILTQQQ